jgi:16S rRNA (adenine1518-N6/adenine1519-N6)-dimethyltransferase
VLTSLIAPQVTELIAVEIDRELASKLAGQFKDMPNVRIVNEDILQFPFENLTGPLKILGNLPYNVSTAIIEKFLSDSFWTTAVIMVQKEVGNRIAAARDTKDYGAFSLLCQYYASIELITHVPPGAFFPRPQVDSVVLRLTNRHLPAADPLFFPFVRYAFSHRRKTYLFHTTCSY